jgi:hypothetical protein
MGGVKIVVQVKLTPTPDQASALSATLDAVNDAANWLSLRAQGKATSETARAGHCKRSPTAS